MSEKPETRIFKNIWFERFIKRERINDTALKEAISEATDGIIAANLGGGVIKQRVARTGQGKSGGYRTIIAFKKDDKAFFMYGFSKNERENLKNNELKAYKEAAKIYLNLSKKEIGKLIENGELKEIEA